ncbi:MAG: N-acetylmuramic acid 6-phosphate etherase [Phycisphaerales bacterium]|nr:N-acetylmuramic acid 6-phosphate etherase [Phycisphaerales bacterium]
MTTEARSAAPLDTLSSAALVDVVATAQAKAAAVVADKNEIIGRFIDATLDAMRAGGRLLYLGAGTSGRLGVLDASECPPTFGSDPNQVLGLIAGGDGALRVSSEGAEDDPEGAWASLDELQVGQTDCVLGIAAGGTTPWVLGGIAHAKARGATTGLLTCARREPPPHCDHCIVLDTGAEVVAGSTRLAAGTATKAALNAISTGVFVRRGAVWRDLMVDLKVTNDKLRDRAIRVLRQLCPALDRVAAAALLDATDGALKTAIVCATKSVSPQDASALIDANDGQLGRLLDAE